MPSPEGGRPAPEPPAAVAEGTYEVRTLENTPEPDVLEFIDRVLRVDCTLDVRKRLQRSIHDYYARFDEPGKTFRSLYFQGRLSGLVAVDRYKESVGTLKWIFVGPEHRGAGLGNWLLDEAITFAVQAGYAKLILCTMTQMEAARHLYARKGFRFRQNVTYWGRKMQVYENVLEDRT